MTRERSAKGKGKEREGGGAGATVEPVRSLSALLLCFPSSWRLFLYFADKRKETEVDTHADRGQLCGTGLTPLIDFSRGGAPQLQ
jgi:hypothetical protein